MGAGDAGLGGLDRIKGCAGISDIQRVINHAIFLGHASPGQPLGKANDRFGVKVIGPLGIDDGFRRNIDSPADIFRGNAIAFRPASIFTQVGDFIDGCHVIGLGLGGAHQRAIHLVGRKTVGAAHLIDRV